MSYSPPIHQRQFATKTMISLDFAIVVATIIVTLLFVLGVVCAKKGEFFVSQTDSYDMPQHNNVLVTNSGHLALTSQVDDRAGQVKVGAAAPGPHKGMVYAAPPVDPVAPAAEEPAKAGFVGSRGSGPAYWQRDDRLQNYYASAGVASVATEAEELFQQSK